MGCSVSKLEADDEPPAGLRPPLRLRLIHRRRPPGRTRKDSIVSTTELLRADESEAGDDAAPPPEMPPLPEAEGDDEQRRRRVGGKGRRPAGDGEDLPGSPSFRFYFKGHDQSHPVVLSEDGSIKDGSRDSSM